MAQFAEGERVVISGDHGEVKKVHPLAEGAWAEQFYTVKLDDNDVYEVTVGESALIAE